MYYQRNIERETQRTTRKDQKQALEDWLQEGSAIPDDMTLQNCVNGVASPM